MTKFLQMTYFEKFRKQAFLRKEAKAGNPRKVLFEKVFSFNEDCLHFCWNKTIQYSQWT